MKTLAIMKMEKNFVAVIEKKYPRKPYEEFSMKRLLDWLDEEVQELHEAIRKIDFENAKWECADVSNIIDCVFEQLANHTIYEASE